MRLLSQLNYTGGADPSSLPVGDMTVFTVSEASSLRAAHSSVFITVVSPARLNIKWAASGCPDGPVNTFFGARRRRTNFSDIAAGVIENKMTYVLPTSGWGVARMGCLPEMNNKKCYYRNDTVDYITYY